ncbi:MAG: SLC13 family permease [Anaerolineales bacterium]|nr:SLC13 family permease [Anaerolineales bacterium]
MTTEMLIVLGILVVAVVFFVTEWLRVDLVALGVVVALVLTGTLTTAEAFAGFSNSSVLTIVFLFVVGGAIMQTGLAGAIGLQILKVAGTEEKRLLVVLMLAVALMSGFMSNTGTVAVLLPAVVILAKKIDLSPSKLLIPLSFGSMLGGAATLIGTPPNLMVNDVLIEAGLEPFNFFSFAPMGLVLMVVGIGFMVLVGRFLLPDNRPKVTGTPGETAEQLVERYHLPENMRRLMVTAESPLDGKTLAEANMRGEFGVNLLKIMRRSERVRLSDLGHNIETRRPRDTPIVPDAQTVILDGDALIVEGDPEAIELCAARWAVEVRPTKPKDIKALVSKDVGVAEVIIRQQSRLRNKTLAESRFGDRYKLSVLEIRRPPQEEPLNRDTTPLRFGDVLLVQGWWENIKSLEQNRRDVIVVGDPAQAMGEPNRDKAPLAMAILVIMVVVMAIGWVPILGDVSVIMVALVAAMAMVLTGCISMDGAYDAIDWKSVVLIAGILPISTAMEHVGLVDVFANYLVNVLGEYGPYAVMIGLFVITATFTQVISNTATAVIIAPLAFSSAQALEISPYAYLMTVAVAASCAFVSPVASPTNTLVMGAGNYRFGDYAKVGLPMLLVCMVAAVVFLPIFFPF